MTRILVIGSGPGGLAAAHRLRRHGSDVEVIEAAPRAGGHLVGLPLCVLDPPARSQLAELGVARSLVTTPAHEEEPRPAPSGSSSPGPARTPGGERLRGLAERWLSSLRTVLPSAVAPPAQPAAELVEGAALAAALAGELPIRFGWEVVEATGSPAGATLRYVAPSGERTMVADAALLALPPASTAGTERRMAVFFEAGREPSADPPRAFHRVPPIASGAAHVWTLRAGEGGRIRIDLLPTLAEALWDASGDEIATSVWDLLPTDLPLAGVRPTVHRFPAPASGPAEPTPDDPRIGRVLPGADLAATLAAGSAAAERLLRQLESSESTVLGQLEPS